MVLRAVLCVCVYVCVCVSMCVCVCVCVHVSGCMRKEKSEIKMQEHMALDSNPDARSNQRRETVAWEKNKKEAEKEDVEG